MIPVPAPEPNDWIVEADGTASAKIAEDFPAARDTDRAAVLVSYVLLGAAVNGFVPYLDRAGGIRSVRAGHRRRPTGVAGYSRTA